MNLSQQTEQLKAMLGTEHVGLVTTDATAVKPGRATVLIQPPEIDSERWRECTAHWTVDIVSGTETTQGKALDDIMQVIDEWTAGSLNIEKASPATFKLGSIALGCYEVRLGDIDL